MATDTGHAQANQRFQGQLGAVGLADAGGVDRQAVRAEHQHTAFVRYDVIDPLNIRVQVDGVQGITAGGPEGDHFRADARPRFGVASIRGG